MNYKTRLKIIVKTVLVVLIFGLIFYFAYYLPFLAADNAPQEFQGTVQEKWVDQTYYGIDDLRNIEVKTDGGEQFKISVDANSFSQVETGMRIKRTSGGNIEIVK